MVAAFNHKDKLNLISENTPCAKLLYTLYLVLCIWVMFRVSLTHSVSSQHFIFCMPCLEKSSEKKDSWTGGIQDVTRGAELKEMRLVRTVEGADVLAYFYWKSAGGIWKLIYIYHTINISILCLGQWLLEKLLLEQYISMGLFFPWVQTKYPKAYTAKSTSLQAY